MNCMESMAYLAPFLILWQFLHYQLFGTCEKNHINSHICNWLFFCTYHFRPFHSSIFRTIHCRGNLRLEMKCRCIANHMWKCMIFPANTAELMKKERPTFWISCRKRHSFPQRNTKIYLPSSKIHDADKFCLFRKWNASQCENLRIFLLPLRFYVKSILGIQERKNC